MPKPAVSRSLSSRKAPKREPLWSGPSGEGPRGGVTQSMIGRFLVCRERFRLYAIEGLREKEGFSHRMEYGNMWHVCEEAYAEYGEGIDGPERPSWTSPLRDYCRDLCLKYPLDRAEIDKWYNVCKVAFPAYVDYWREHEDEKERTPLLQEQTFDIPYTLPSGRVVRLRGKWDSVDLIGKGKNAAIYLKENKAKGDVDEQQMRDELPWDLQTNLYLTALHSAKVDRVGSLEVNGIKGERGRTYLFSLAERASVGGVRYNVVRRPLSGGKHSITQHKGRGKLKAGAETSAEFYERLGGLIRANPAHFFMRWKVEVLPSDLKRFQRECLNPILEQMYDWYSFVTTHRSPFDWGTNQESRVHFRMPTGVYNPLLEGRRGDYYEFLHTGNDRALERVDSLFRELE